MKAAFSLMLVLVSAAACGGVDRLGFVSAPDASLDQEGAAGTRGGTPETPTGSADAGSSGAGQPSTSGTAGQAAAGDGEGTTHDALCGQGPLACDQARASFARALCTCADASGPGSLSVEALGTGNAAVGVDGAFGLRIDRRTVPSPLMGANSGSIAGDVTIAGSGPSAISGLAPVISGSVSTSGSLAFVGNVRVAGDVYSSDAPFGNGTLLIDGALQRRNAGPVPQNVIVTGAMRVADYTVAPPCACGDAQRFDVASRVAAAAKNHDDASAKLTSASLAPAPGTLALDCGRYYFAGVQSDADLRLELSGRTQIFVDGDMVVHGDVAVQLAPGAELELFVNGDLQLSGAARFGDAARPAASRIYVSGAVTLGTMPDRVALVRPNSALGDAVFVGNLYAPAATLQLVPHTDVYGSLFVRELSVLQSLFMHYDASVVDSTGGACAP